MLYLLVFQISIMLVPKVGANLFVGLRQLSSLRKVTLVKPQKPYTCNFVPSRQGSGEMWYRMDPKTSATEYKMVKFFLAVAFIPLTYMMYYHPYDVIPFFDDHKTVHPEHFTDAELGVPPDDWEDETDPVNFGMIKDHPYQKLIKAE